MFANVLGVLKPFDRVDPLEIVEPALGESGGDRTDQVADEFGVSSPTDDLDGFQRSGFLPHHLDDFRHDGRVGAFHHHGFGGGANGIGCGTQEIFDGPMFDGSENEQAIQEYRKIRGIGGGDRPFEIFNELIADEQRIANGVGGVIIGMKVVMKTVGELADQLDDLSAVGDVGVFKILDQRGEVLIALSGGNDGEGVGTKSVVTLKDGLPQCIREDREVAFQDFQDTGGVEVDAADHFEMGISLAAEDQGFGGGGPDGGGFRSQPGD